MDETFVLGDLDDYQSLAKSTAIYPRVYTEDQVREIAKDVVRAYIELFDESAIARQRAFELTNELLDKHETEFSRMVYPVLGLVGEAGEVANKLKKVARDDRGLWGPDQTQDYEKELGDVMWYVAAVATGLKSSLQKIGTKNIQKLFSRKARGVLGGSGDDR